MKVKILDHTMRRDGSLLRFSVEFTELNQTGSYGIQLELPATIEQLKYELKTEYKKVQKKIEEADTLRVKYAQFIDREFELI